MPSYQMPTLNQNYARSWDEADVNKFHRMPYWTSLKQAEITKDVQVHAKLSGSVKWESNKGTQLRTIIPQHTPIQRQFLRPKQLLSLPRIDTVNPGQRELVDTVVEHQIASDYISWVPEFYDMYSSMKLVDEDIARRVAMVPELIDRTYKYHQSRYMMFCGRNANSSTPAYSILGRDIVLAQQGLGEETDGSTDPTNGKTLSWLKPFILGMNGETGLTLGNVIRAITFMEQQGMGPYKGANKIGAENSIPAGKYLLVLGGEANSQWVFDPLVRGLSGANANLLNGKYTTPMLDRVITLTEERPIRYAIDSTTLNLSIPEPETVELTGPNAGETIPNPTYLEAPIEIAYLYSGVTFCDTIKVGPPPSAFAKNGPSGNFAKMSWNGEIITYKPNIVQISNGSALVSVENRDGRWLQKYANVAGGCRLLQAKAVLPIAFKRSVGSNIIP